MIKAHNIRLHPTTKQAIYFAKAAGTARCAFNWAVAEWKRQYEAGEKPSALKVRTQFHALRKAQLPWTHDVTKCAIEGAFMDVAAAFKHFRLDWLHKLTTEIATTSGIVAGEDIHVCERSDSQLVSVPFVLGCLCGQALGSAREQSPGSG